MHIRKLPMKICLIDLELEISTETYTIEDVYLQAMFEEADNKSAILSWEEA